MNRHWFFKLGILFDLYVAYREKGKVYEFFLWQAAPSESQEI